jgi:ABC-type proline/glycine betaine transport system ATPase subunit
VLECGRIVQVGTLHELQLAPATDFVRGLVMDLGVGFRAGTIRNL